MPLDTVTMGEKQEGLYSDTATAMMDEVQEELCSDTALIVDVTVTTISHCAQNCNHRHLHPMKVYMSL
jgi:hypothetical protein